tara:strand:- start:231 stop:656 length:426 start_codon:yes stop_codon:yes gene_type:complete
MIDIDKYEGHAPPPYIVHELESWTQNFGGELDNKLTYFREYTIDAPNRKGLKELVRTQIKDYHEKRLKKWHGLTHSKELVEPYNRPYLSFTNEAKATARLMADAPLLLAEVKRLREGINEVLNECWPNATAMMRKLKEMIE